MQLLADGGQHAERLPSTQAIDRAFHEAWRDAGGDDFALHPQAPAGPTALRVVLHRGLRDAHTLDAYLALIHAARSSLCVVNSFPLQLEVQHALLGAVARGVRVRLLFGRVRPVYRDATPFPGGTRRELATQLVRARLDVLVRAGAEAYELALPLLPGWAPELGSVHPSVHAKLVTSDGRICAVGSANLDVTAGYWESEALLVIEDAAMTLAVDDEIGRLIAGSMRIDPNDPQWQRDAARRVWLGRHWPSTIG